MNGGLADWDVRILADDVHRGEDAVATLGAQSFDESLLDRVVGLSHLLLAVFVFHLILATDTRETEQ